jgi:hypothetical protein
MLTFPNAYFPWENVFKTIRLDKDIDNIDRVSHTKPRESLDRVKLKEKLEASISHLEKTGRAAEAGSAVGIISDGGIQITLFANGPVDSSKTERTFELLVWSTKARITGTWSC